MGELSQDAGPPSVTYTEREGYLEARFPATEKAPVVLALGREMVRRCQDLKPARLPVDFSALRIQPSTLERYEMGNVASQLAPSVNRVAVVAPASLIDPKKFGTQVASNRGLTVDIFPEREAAIAWLTAG